MAYDFRLQAVDAANRTRIKDPIIFRTQSGRWDYGRNEEMPYGDEDKTRDLRGTEPQGSGSPAPPR